MATSLHPIDNHGAPPKGWAGVSLREAAMAGSIAAGLLGLAIAGVGAREVPIIFAALGGIGASIGAAIARRHA
jgi:hypothetical protein